MDGPDAASAAWHRIGTLGLYGRVRTRIATIYQGRLVASGTVAELRSDVSYRSAGLRPGSRRTRR